MQPPTASDNTHNIDNIWLQKHQKHALMPAVGIDGLLALKKSHIGIIGLGGLGCFAGTLLAMAGIGKLSIIDHDTIELSNLSRQMLYTPKDINQYKVHIAQKKLLDLNPDIEINISTKKLTAQNTTSFPENCSILLDCTDNTTTRQTINNLCIASKTPLLSCSVIQTSGLLCLLDFSTQESPCYACLFPSSNSTESSCIDSGVFSPAVGIMGSMQASEALKFLLKMPTSSLNQLLVFDALTNKIESIAITEKTFCPRCKRKESLHSLNKLTSTT